MSGADMKLDTVRDVIRDNLGSDVADSVRERVTVPVWCRAQAAWSPDLQNLRDDALWPLDDAIRRLSCRPEIEWVIPELGLHPAVWQLTYVSESG